MGQVERFIREVRQKGIYIERLRLLGGEPLLHPEADDFIKVLFYELIIPGNLDRIEIVTNGTINTEERFTKIMRDPNIKKAFDIKVIKFNISYPNEEESFRWVLAAPVDLGFEWHICRLPYECGSNLNTYGYWPGGSCGAVARLFCRSDYARQHFPVNFIETWPNIKEDLCKYCGSGCSELVTRKEGPVSLSYENAIKRWRDGKGCFFEKLQ